MEAVAGSAGSRWADAAAWRGDGLRREVFFFESRGVPLYGSLYAAAEPSRSLGVVACGSWGVEADRSDPLLRSVALATARLGGAALVFHYPGYGDSYGDLAEVDMGQLVAAAADALAEGARRCPDAEWTLAGFMFGAAVACLAQPLSRARRLLLLQPSLRPVAYFQRLSSRSRPLPLGSPAGDKMVAGSDPGMAYGYPVPSRILEDSAADAAVADALAQFEGEGTVLAHADEEPDLAPPRFERVVVPGRWRFGARNNPGLAAAATAWLERAGAVGVR